MSSLLFLLSGTRKKSGKDAFNVEETPSKIQGKLMAVKSHKVYYKHFFKIFNLKKNPIK